MERQSNIDLDKLEKVPAGRPFEYKDVVSDKISIEQHTEDGRRFKEEVQQGQFSNVKIEKDTGSHLLYKKI